MRIQARASGDAQALGFLLPWISAPRRDPEACFPLYSPRQAGLQGSHRVVPCYMPSKDRSLIPSLQPHPSAAVGSAFQRGASILSWPSFLPKVYQVQSLLHAVRLSLEDKLPMTVFCKLGRTRRKQKAYYCHPRNTAAFTNQPRIYFFFLAPRLSEVKSENSRATRGLSAICDPAGHDGTSL